MRQTDVDKVKIRVLPGALAQNCLEAGKKAGKSGIGTPFEYP
jgi:hypothetical protein